MLVNIYYKIQQLKYYKLAVLKYSDKYNRNKIIFVRNQLTTCIQGFETDLDDKTLAF